MQGRLIAGVVVVGAAIGFLIPSGPPQQPPAPAAKPAPETPLAEPESAAESTVSGPHKTVLYRNADGHFYADALVDGEMIHFVVDTGATDVVLTMDDARKLRIPFDRSKFEVIARGASGDVRGTNITLHRVSIDRQEAFEVRAAIVDEGLDVSLLGQSWLGSVDSVQISGDRMTLG